MSQTEKKSHKPLRVFTIAKFARQNTEKNLAGLAKSNDPTETLRCQSLLAKTYLDLLAAKNKTVKLLANLEADLAYLIVQANANPLAGASVTNPKFVIARYFMERNKSENVAQPDKTVDEPEDEPDLPIQLQPVVVNPVELEDQLEPIKEMSIVAL